MYFFFVVARRPCPLLLPQPPVCSRLGLDAGTGARSGKPAGEVSCAVRGICARNLCSTDQHGTEPATATAIHSASAFFRRPLCLGRIPLSPGKPRPSHGLAWAVRTYQIRLSPRPRQTTPSSPLRLSVSILQSPLPPPIPVHRPPQAGIVRCGTHPWSWGKTEIPTGWVVLQP